MTDMPRNWSELRGFESGREVVEHRPALAFYQAASVGRTRVVYLTSDGTAEATPCEVLWLETPPPKEGENG